MKSNDEWIDINFTNDRINPYRNTPLADIMREIKSLNLRFVKVILGNGTEEYLLTNLNTEFFTYDDINYLYNLRWKIETVYDILKNKIQMVNFTGEKSRIIEQYIYLCNLMHSVVNETQKEFDQENDKEYKYEMKINKNLAIGVLKEDFIEIILSKNPEERHILFETYITI